jgi:carbamoyltransferase
MRDFWMPFAPSMLAERQHDYIDNPKNSKAGFMILAFPSLPAASKDIISALHPMDLTCRPQLVDEKTNPKYCKILKSYEKLTGMGAFLNTSFNLHGDPIVNTPEDAVRTLLNSQLDYVVMENYLVWRKK